MSYLFFLISVASLYAYYEAVTIPKDDCLKSHSLSYDLLCLLNGRHGQTLMTLVCGAGLFLGTGLDGLVRSNVLDRVNFNRKGRHDTLNKVLYQHKYSTSERKPLQKHKEKQA